MQGANSYGQLGLGHKSESEAEPKQVNLEGTGLKAEDIIAISGGGGHTLILDNSGHVFCCGWNAKGQLGLTDDSLKFVQIEILKGFKVVQICCGWDFSTAVTDCGKLFVWGNNSYTQLGLSKSITCTGIPSLVQVSQKLATGFKHIRCGLRHTSMITKDDGILVAGIGNKGQLGLGDNYDDNSYMSISKLTLEEVKSVACGEHHTLALKSNGTVFAWGDNKYGQLGLNTSMHNSFVPLEVFQHEGIEQVFSGWTHSAALTSTGEVFIWGRNNYGQLGCERDEAYKPELNPALKNIKQLSLGSEHCLAVTEEGKLMSWGWNEHGSCGSGDKKDVMKPQEVLSGQKVRYAAACTGQSFAVVD